MSRIVRTEYSVSGNRPVVWCFSRDEKGKRVIMRDASLKPYFYVPTGSQPHDISIDLNGMWRTEKDCATSVDGRRLDMIETILPEHVSALRESFDKTYEADVMFPSRYLIDKVDSLERVELRVLTIDIETDTDGRNVPDPTRADQPINCVTVHDSYDDAFITVAFRKDLKPSVKCRMYEGRLQEIHLFNNELSMLNCLFGIMRELEPDVITGWYVIRFDLTYLITRAMRISGAEYWKMSPMNRVYLRDSRENNVVIKGVACVDLYDAYRQFTFSGRELHARVHRTENSRKRKTWVRVRRA